MSLEQLSPGFVIAGKYVIERTIGRGGMGAVYVATHALTGKRVALKCLLPEFVHNADMVGRFMREAQVMGRLQHRHVVDVYDVGRDGDVLYIVMELLEGKPLSDLLADATLTLEEALVILLRAMEGVAAAHDHGVVHRDLKPDNIFVSIGASGRLDDPRVLDFGISKLDDGISQHLTRSGVAMGTPHYMCIEQLSGQRDLDARVDVYAMGVILYEAIAGEPPYTAESLSALAIRVLTTEPVHLGELRPDLPAGLADVVMKAMARQREERYRSIRQLIEAIRPFVPRSAGLLVPEGQGRPLRTPRSGRLPAQPASTIKSIARPALPRSTERTSPAAPHLPLSSPPPPAGASRRLMMWGGAGLALALIAAGSTRLLRSGAEEHGPRPSIPAPALPRVGDPPPAATTPPPSAPVAEKPSRPTPASGGSPDARVTTPAPDAGARAPTAPLAKPAPVRKLPLRTAPGAAAPASAPTVTEPAPPQPAPAVVQPTPAPAGGSSKSAEGRAGRLDSDEF